LAGSLHSASLKEASVSSILLYVGSFTLFRWILDIVMAFGSIALGLSIKLGTLAALIAWGNRRHFAHFEFPFLSLIEESIVSRAAVRNISVYRQQQKEPFVLWPTWLPLGANKKGKTMARDEHNKAAEHHENAAKAHRSAAEHYGKGDHAKGKEHASTAKQHSQTANQHSDQAHSKSQQQK
jgi:hypothetical protein